MLCSKLSFPQYKSGLPQYGIACGLLLGVLTLSGCSNAKPQAVKKDSGAAETPPAATATPTPAHAATKPASDMAQGNELSPPAAETPAPVTPPASIARNTQDDQPGQLPAIDPTEFQRQLMSGLQIADATDPPQLIDQLQRTDVAIQDLMRASANSAISEATFIECGLALGRLKLDAARRLAESPNATTEQRKAGQLAQLVALSHLSGFRDVTSAKELEKYASELSKSSDLDLAHQSRVVLMGFQLQALQNGLTDDPNELLAQAEGLFTRPVDRNFPELMMLLQSNQVLSQMGFEAAAKRMHQILVEEFADSPDPQLRAEAWNVQTRGSQALENYLIAFRSLGTPNFDSQTAIAAARGLFEAFPSLQTLEQLATTVTNIEYSGNVDLARQMVELIELQRGKLDASAEQQAGIDSVLAGHTARISLIGKPLPLEDIVRFNGEPLSRADFEGKVVLVDFWATWCVPCMREIPTIRSAYEGLHDQGFEVLSVNMDENLEDAQKFLDNQRFAWTTHRSADTEALGFKSAFAQRLGISAIPFMLLVDREGNVVDIHVRGDKLIPRVREMLGLSASLIPE
ncbi:MAG: thioredoxin-like domain-containing protein [Pirellulaceae bacterium]